MTQLEDQNLILCAWRLDRNIDAERYIDALDKLIFLAKKEILAEVNIMVADCIKKGLATQFILTQGLPEIEKKQMVEGKGGIDGNKRYD